MKVTIFGSGYVGLVTGACLAEVGNDVLCVDIDTDKIARLNRGEVPIYEPGLGDLIERGLASQRLRFTSDAQEGVDHGLFQFITVGTPPDEDGSADLRYVLEVADTIAAHMQEYRIVVDKSTVPVGTADKVAAALRAGLDARTAPVEFDVVSNPEFLKEGAAVSDFMSPDRIIVGTDNPRTAELLKALYAPFNRNTDRMIAMDIRSAELTKYAANAMLATKISFMNELSHIAERLGADIEKVRHGIGSDHRIGHSFIYPGAGYGGSCFPKDVSALTHSAGEVGYRAELLEAVTAVNARQKSVLFDRVSRHFDGDLKGRTFALWGLAFKPDTDDMREAASRVLMEALWAAGASVRAHDPEAMRECGRIYGRRPDLTLCDKHGDALDGADGLIVVTEWLVYRSPDFDEIKARLRVPVIFDGRNLYRPELLRRFGISYYSIGRAEVRL